MTPMLFDIGASEFLVIILLAVILFGPEKIPELAKKAARLFRYLRTVANSATDSLKSELGPEYADLTVADLHPKRLLQRTLGDLDDLQVQVATSGQQLKDALGDLGEAKQPLIADSEQTASVVPAQSKTDPVIDDGIDSDEDIDSDEEIDSDDEIEDDSDADPDDDLTAAEREGLVDLPGL